MTSFNLGIRYQYDDRGSEHPLPIHDPRRTGPHAGPGKSLTRKRAKAVRRLRAAEWRLKRATCLPALRLVPIELEFVAHLIVAGWRHRICLVHKDPDVAVWRAWICRVGNCDNGSKLLILRTEDDAIVTIVVGLLVIASNSNRVRPEFWLKLWVAVLVHS